MKRNGLSYIKGRVYQNLRELITFSLFRSLFSAKKCPLVSSPVPAASTVISKKPVAVRPRS